MTRAAIEVASSADVPAHRLAVQCVSCGQWFSVDPSIRDSRPLRRLGHGLTCTRRCEHGWWPCRRFLLPRKYRCLFCRATTRSPWR